MEVPGEVAAEQVTLVYVFSLAFTQLLRLEPQSGRSGDLDPGKHSHDD